VTCPSAAYWRSVLDPDDAAEQRTILGMLIEALGEHRFEAECRRGSKLGLAETLVLGQY
jgi:hypothetical protein